MSSSRLSPKSIIWALTMITLLPAVASAQYYTPTQAPVSHAHQPGGAGLDLGLRQGLYPSAGVGLGPFGLGAGAGVGAQGFGAGGTAGAGPLGGSADAGLGPRGFGSQASVGWGRQTGAAFDAGVTQDGIGLGGRTEILGFGTGGSVGVGHRGPDLGASLAFGPLGTLQLGSHAVGSQPRRAKAAYPGSIAGHPDQGRLYYKPRPYGHAPYYRPVAVSNYGQTCPVGWTC